jgi:hypothetical protein
MILAFFILFFAFALSKEACCLPDAWEGLANGWDRRSNASFFEMVSYDFKMEALRVDRFENFRDSNHRHHSSLFVLRDRRGIYSFFTS